MDAQTRSSMHDRPGRIVAEPVVHSQMPPTRSIQRGISQLVRLLILLPRNAPEASPNAHHGEVVAQPIEFAEEPLIAKMATLSVHVPILAPGGDPRRHAVDQVSRVGFDDDLRDVAFVNEMAAGEHLGKSSQGVDGCAEFSALAGRPRILHLEGLVVVRVDVEEDAASSDGFWTTVVATGAIGGDDDCVAVGGEVVALVTHIAIIAGPQLDQVILPSTVADVMVIASSSHEVLSGDVADVVALVVALAPVVDRIINASGRVLHRGC